ncbi:hypothetical protein AKJ09_08033 [Labilithrix luteola]|uniref:Uncharacterized protein n=1 Tax=Labilithrix luteola TaxID=1391654 RepID=A0A0K1Q7I9_9BACT|nr:hypothetical protein AKJ09_08033 [Labilithrix luteola]
MSTTSASAVPSPPATAASAKKPAASITPTAVASKLTDEQWGRQAVAAQSSGLLGCMEQDLVRNPNAPKAYTVSVLIESDGAPLNSSTTFSPTASSGFTMCARNVIFYGFNGRYGSGPPSHKPFTFATSVAFPNAKPAAKAESGRGWD